MPRRNEPWKRGGQGPWKAKIDGRLVTLAPESASKAEAARVLRSLLVERDRGQRHGPAVRVAGLVTAFLADCDGQVERGEMRRATAEHYRNNLRFFGPALGALEAEQVQPHQVKAFLDGHPTWNSTTRAGVVTTVKRLFRWAKQDGRIRINPLADLKKPKPLRREAIPTPEGALRALAGCVSVEFRDYLWVLHETGCRPGEARAIEARDLDLDRGFWRRPGKTTGVTGEDRIVYLTPGLTRRLATLAKRWPRGPVLRNTEGNPWKPNAINCQMIRLRGRLRRAGYEVGNELVPYGFRHLFVTDALENGVPIATVAELVGHRSTIMISKHYSHLVKRSEHMQEALGKVRGRGRNRAASEGS